jgi:hypothetical protein
MSVLLFAQLLLSAVAMFLAAAIWKLTQRYVDWLPDMDSNLHSRPEKHSDPIMFSSDGFC